MFKTDFSKLEAESQELELKIELLVGENNQLLEKIHKAESDLVQNRPWNSSSEAFNWLNTHHSRNKKGLGFVSKRVTKPANKKYVGLSESILYFHCGKTGHYQYACSLRNRAVERNSVYVKQIWIRKDELMSMSKKMGPKWI